MVADRPGFLIVSGCPRSGTSVCMDIQRAAHGDDAILGQKFPQESRREMRTQLLKRQPDERDRQHQVRRYLLGKQIAHEESQMSADEKRWRDMNPEGFWEMAFTCRGIIYHPQFKQLLQEALNGDTKIVKVVSQGLMASNPLYIGKIIYMLRHPRAVAKSQERLVRGFNIKDPTDGKIKNMFEGMTIHTPEMFIMVTAQAARFFLENPEIPLHFVHFKDLLEKPSETIDRMSEFVGCGDYGKAREIVQPKLNRSKHEDIESALWPDAEFVYERMCEAAAIINTTGDRAKGNEAFQQILDYMADPKRAIHREKRSWRCYRAKMMVNEAMCRQCSSNADTRANFRRHSERTPGQVADHWATEPCLFECGMDLDRDTYLTIEESVKNNFWVSDIEARMPEPAAATAD